MDFDYWFWIALVAVLWMIGMVIWVSMRVVRQSQVTLSQKRAAILKMLPLFSIMLITICGEFRLITINPKNNDIQLALFAAYSALPFTITNFVLMPDTPNSIYYKQNTSHRLLIRFVLVLSILFEIGGIYFFLFYPVNPK